MFYFYSGSYGNSILTKSEESNLGVNKVSKTLSHIIHVKTFMSIVTTIQIKAFMSLIEGRTSIYLTCPYKWIQSSAYRYETQNKFQMLIQWFSIPNQIFTWRQPIYQKPCFTMCIFESVYML